MGDTEVGLELPNVGDGATLDRCRQVARRAVDAGISSLWMTDHLLVGPEAADSYGTVVEPLSGLSILSGEFDDVSLGTSILLLPLRNPLAVAKQCTVLQEATGGGSGSVSASAGTGPSTTCSDSTSTGAATGPTSRSS